MRLLCFLSQGVKTPHLFYRVKSNSGDAGGARFVSSVETIVVGTTSSVAEDEFNMTGLPISARRNYLYAPASRARLRTIGGDVLNASQKDILSDMHLVRIFSKDGDQVFVDEMGTGTSVEASLVWMRDVIGVEPDQQQFEGAVARIRHFISGMISEKRHLSMQAWWKHHFCEMPMQAEAALAEAAKELSAKQKETNRLAARKLKGRKKKSGDGDGDADDADDGGDDDAEEEFVIEDELQLETFEQPGQLQASQQVATLAAQFVKDNRGRLDAL